MELKCAQHFPFLFFYCDTKRAKLNILSEALIQHFLAGHLNGVLAKRMVALIKNYKILKSFYIYANDGAENLESGDIDELVE